MTASVPLAHPSRQREALLLEYVRELSERRAGHRAAWLHLSNLDASNRRDHHVRTAASGFAALVDGRAVHAFVLADADIVVVYDLRRHDQVRLEVEKILYLFGEDPTVADDPRHARFVTWYDIERDYDSFLRDVRARCDGRASANAPPPIGAAPIRLATRQSVGDSLTPQKLEQIERVLATADLSNLMRRQTACAIDDDYSVAPRFTELFVSIADLRDTVLPDGNLSANPWLFRRLTQTLDRRVLSFLTAADSRFDGATISVNVNLSTLLSGAFAVIDGGLAGAGPSAVAFEVQAVDVFSDISSFLFARDFAHQRGFRMFLDSLSWREAAIVRPGPLGVDLVKVVWDPAFAEPDSEARRNLERLTKGYGSDRVAICRADSQEAVRTGHEFGLRLFQGHFVDELLRENGRRRSMQRLKRPRLRDT